jgi:hypothetical protein
MFTMYVYRTGWCLLSAYDHVSFSPSPVTSFWWPRIRDPLTAYPWYNYPYPYCGDVLLPVMMMFAYYVHVLYWSYVTVDRTDVPLSHTRDLVLTPYPWLLDLPLLTPPSYDPSISLHSTPLTLNLWLAQHFGLYLPIISRTYCTMPVPMLRTWPQCTRPVNQYILTLLFTSNLLLKCHIFRTATYSMKIRPHNLQFQEFLKFVLDTNFKEFLKFVKNQISQNS